MSACIYKISISPFLIILTPTKIVNIPPGTSNIILVVEFEIKYACKFNKPMTKAMKPITII